MAEKKLRMRGKEGNAARQTAQFQGLKIVQDSERYLGCGNETSIMI